MDTNGHGNRPGALRFPLAEAADGGHGRGGTLGHPRGTRHTPCCRCNVSRVLPAGQRFVGVCVVSSEGCQLSPQSASKLQGVRIQRQHRIPSSLTGHVFPQEAERTRAGSVQPQNAQGKQGEDLIS